jgi:hypothetical protein
MRRLVTRKLVVFAVAMLALALLGFFLSQYTSPFPLRVPKDHILVRSFHAHRQVFETLKQMADEDAMMASSNGSESLSVARRFEYARLLSQIGGNTEIGFDALRTVISFGQGGILLSIGPA